MSYRLTLKAFKQEQEDQNKAIQALNDRVQIIEHDLGLDQDQEDDELLVDYSIPIWSWPEFFSGLIVGGFLTALAHMFWAF